VPKAIILTADKFEDMELFFPYFRLLEEGFEVDIAAPKKGGIRGEHGYGLEIERTFDEINPKDYDLLIIPGGSPDGAPATVGARASRDRVARLTGNQGRQSTLVGYPTAAYDIVPFKRVLLGVGT